MESPWPPELIGFVMGMCCSKEGRDALAKADELGVPHRGLRAVVREAHTGNGTLAIREHLRLYLQALNVTVDPRKGVQESVGDHVAALCDKGRRTGPLRAEVRNLVAELYDATRHTVAWPCDRVDNLVRKLQEAKETLKL
jgi:hypothetical protein